MNIFNNNNIIEKKNNTFIDSYRSIKDNYSDSIKLKTKNFNQKLKKKGTNKDSVIKELNLKIKFLENQLIKKNSNLKKVTKNLLNKQDEEEIPILKSTIKKLKFELNNEFNKNQILSDLNIKLKNEIKIKDNKILTLTTNNINLDSNYTNYKLEIENLNKYNFHYNNDLSGNVYNNNLLCNSSELNKLYKIIEELVKQKNGWTNELKISKNDYDKYKKKSKKLKKDLEIIILENSNNLRILKENENNYKIDISRLKKDIEIQKSNKLILETQQQNHNSSLNINFKKKNEKLKKINNENKKEINSLRQNLVQMDSIFNSIKNKNPKPKDNKLNDGLKMKIKDLEEENEELVKKIESLNHEDILDENQTLKDLLGILKDKFNNMKDDNFNLLEKIDEEISLRKKINQDFEEKTEYFNEKINQFEVYKNLMYNFIYK